MALNFCTYFDANYLDRGLLLYASLRQHCPEMQLFALCLDSRCFAVLNDLALEALTPIALPELEAADPELSAVKPHRTRIEYYFTLTPSYICHMFTSRPELDHMTYVDADLYFYADPGPVISESCALGIGIVSHRYPASMRDLERFGKFNVAFNVFDRSDRAMACLRRWRRQCIEWCHDRIDGTRYADQKYLDEWPAQYGNGIIIHHPGVDLGPWNLSNHILESTSGRLTVNGAPLICFHFHGVTRLLGPLYDPNLRRYKSPLTPSLKTHLYAPYVNRLDAIRRRHGGLFSGTPIRHKFFAASPRTPFREIAHNGIDQLTGLMLTLMSGTLITADGVVESMAGHG